MCRHQQLFIYSAQIFSALQTVTNPRTKSAQTVALLCHSSLTSFFTSHTQVRLYLVWTSGDVTLEGQMEAKKLAAEAANAIPHRG